MDHRFNEALAALAAYLPELVFHLLILVTRFAVLLIKLLK